MPRSATVIPLLCVLLGCPSSPPQPTPPGDLTCDSTEALVQFSTSDGVTLAADDWPAATQNRGAVVLLHMIPPSNDRSGYPPSVRQAIHDLGLTVLNIDRRGAGDSGGEAADAYTGPGGLWDVEAAVRHLVSADRACPVDPDRIALVGASNGTTSVWDYAAAHDPALPEPAALTFLSPGGYTEAQHPVDPGWDRPLQWLYPITEPWSAGFVGSAPGSWTFVERGDQHGTRMFDGGELQDQTLGDLTAWLTQHVGG